MNLVELIREFRIQSQDTVKPYLWPDEELIKWFSNAEAEAAIRSRLITDETEILLSSGDTFCDLPCRLFNIDYAELRDASGKAYELKPTDRLELDNLRPGWRTRSERPVAYIHDDKRLVFGSVIDRDYTLYLSFYRIPKQAMENDCDSPEIGRVHHIKLIDWVLHMAYKKPDADAFNPGKSADAEAEFTRNFGRRPNADLRRRQNANRPHRNKVHL